MKTKNLSKWLILLLCACVVTFYSCDKVDYDQKDPKEMKKQEEKKKQEEEKKKQEEEKKKQEEEKKKQEEEKKKQEEEKKKQEEEKKKQEEEKKKQLTLDPTSLTLKSLQAKNVNIKNGTAPYEVKVADGKIAGVKVYENDNYIVVTGLNEGTTEIVVTDKNMKKGTVKVTTSNH